MTLRALFAGCLLGALLAVANVYAGLKTGSADGGSITAAVLAFATFSAMSRGALPYTKLENNFTQTVASSAAVMSFVTGVTGPVPALAMTGHPLGAFAIGGLGLALSTLGIVLALLLRPRLIEAERLPFPTGRATAEVISAMADSRGSATRRARALFAAGLFAAVVTLLRDGPGAILPQDLLWPGSIAGLSGAALSVGVSVSPLMFATGIMSGVHAGASMLLGSCIAWMLLVPALTGAKIVDVSDQGALFNWLMWPGAALILSSSLAGLLLQWRGVLRGVRDLRSLLTRRDMPDRASESVSAASRQRRADRQILILLSMACAGAVVAIGHSALGLGLGTVLLTLTLSFVLSTVCARAAGETDIAPVGTMGGITQIMFGSASRTASLGCGTIVAGQATGTAQMLWALEAGRRLKASVRAQVIGQLVGSCVGVLVVLPTYEVVSAAYRIGSPKMPAPGVMSWKATADAVQGGLSVLPSHAPQAAFAALGLGCVLTLLGATRVERFVPSPVAMGIAFLLPPSLSVTMFLGAFTLFLLGIRFPAWTEQYAASIAGGALAGESLLAVMLAALICLGVIAG